MFRSHLPVVLFAGLAAVAAHWGSLDDGLFLDDHIHQHALKSTSWSWSDLLDSTTIEPDSLVHAWWQDQEIGWDYCRPFAMAVMKLTGQVVGWNPVALHASNLAWHVVVTALVYLLCLEVTRRRSWSGVASFAFAIYPHTVYTVGWLAAQNAMIQTATMLIALLLYMRASGRSTVRTTSSLRRGFFAASVVFFLIALSARESAAVYGVMMVACDLAWGGWERVRRRWPAYSIIAALTVAYVVWRVLAFGREIPDVYLRRPDFVEYPLWLLAKLMHYLCSVVWVNPLFVGPTGYDNPWIEAPVDTLVMTAIVGVLGTAYWRACKGVVRGWWLWPLWILLSVLPVLPILATPHTGYMAGVGFVIACVAKPAAVGPRRARVAVAWLAYVLAISLTATVLYRMCWRGVVRSEQFTIAQMTAQPHNPTAEDVYLINLPLANIYLPINMGDAWNDSDTQFHVLTFAPHLLVPPDDCRIEHIDSHTFDLVAGAHGYFSGLLGQFLVDAMRSSEQLPLGRSIDCTDYSVVVMEGDASGVARLRFRFSSPLDDPHRRFFVMTTDCPGAELTFGAGAGTAHLDSTGRVSQASSMRSARDRLFEILWWTARFVRTDLYLTRSVDSPRPGV
jgi:hypothetical protein